jgi:hypothetical protein
MSSSASNQFSSQVVTGPDNLDMTTEMGLDSNNAEVELRFRIVNKLKSGKPGSKLKFTINCYHTSYCISWSMSIYFMLSISLFVLISYPMSMLSWFLIFSEVNGIWILLFISLRLSSWLCTFCTSFSKIRICSMNVQYASNKPTGTLSHARNVTAGSTLNA